MPDLRTSIQDARMHKRWSDLEACARQLLTADPQSVYAIQLIGESLEKRGRTDEAIQHYEKALEIDTDNESGSGQTGFLQRLDILYFRANRYEDCLRVCRYYAARHPDRWDAWNRLRRAAERTSNSQLSSAAKERADTIKAEEEAAHRAREVHHQRWMALFEKKLYAMGLKMRAPLLSQREKCIPEPELDAPDDEWGQWLQDTADIDTLDAEVHAALAASVELERTEINERLGPLRRMTAQERRKAIFRELGDLKAGGVGSLVFTDREMLDNSVRLTPLCCEISAREYPGSELPPLGEEERKSLVSCGFARLELGYFSRYSFAHNQADVETLAEIVMEVFEILGSSTDFEILIERHP
jgi:hypothetical protein